MDFTRGRIVCSKAGRDKGLYFAVLAEQDGRVLVANGSQHKLAKPKAKNPAHLAMTAKVLPPALMENDKLLTQAIAELVSAAPQTT